MAARNVVFIADGRLIKTAYNARMAPKKTPNLEQRKARTGQPVARRNASQSVRGPIVMTVKSGLGSKQVRAAVSKLAEAGVLRPSSFDQARAFLGQAASWGGPGYVLLIS